MTTNDFLNAPISDATRKRLDSVGRGLLRLHKALLDVERSDYEALYGRVSPGQMLQLLIGDDWFAWLRVLSELVVQVDEMAEAKEGITEKNADVLLKQVRAILLPTEEETDFSGKYQRALQHNPTAVLRHAEVLQLLPATI